MPELPDVTVYVDALRERVLGQPLTRVRLRSFFLLRTATPKLPEAHGRAVTSVARLGKRIVLGLESGDFLVLHLMVTGRLRWRKAGARPPGKIGLAAFDFPTGTLLLTEAGSRKRASLHYVRGRENLAAFDPGGVEPLEAGLDAFREALARESHTLKRALTDPRLVSGVGNAYSDEILHRARLSPFKLTSKLDAEETERLHKATREVLTEWTERLRAEAKGRFPEKVTAFHDAMAVHGRYRKSCPVCETPVQRVRYAENEMNYCPRCQTGGKVLADRALSRLLRDDWPRRIEDLEEKLPGRE